MAPLSQGHPHAPAGALANAAARAAMYCGAPRRLIASVVQPSHAEGGHEETEPTATQSLSTAQD
jgi:hypothetical protein